ncbi:TIR domain-containing protein [Vreelandella venusta]|uniref:TIR domain-containing protein n=1 Tax=Vreelandella venusta TaxID=44935 RepID=UPI003C2E4FA9
MFNLLIRCGPDSWESSPVEFEKGRVATEYTLDEISERYKSLDRSVIKELKSFPSLFVCENEPIASRVGYITEIKLRPNKVAVFFEFEPEIPPLEPGALESLRVDIGLGRFELSRTHWAVKDEDLFEILSRRGFATHEQITASKYSRLQNQEVANRPPDPGSAFNKTQVFIVHGHDEPTKLDMAEFIQGLGLEPIILHMQASGGRTIIEKIEQYTNVGFGIILYTPCDVGAKRDSLIFKRRARQNVVFEHGYLIAKLGRSRVVAMVKDDVEVPNDISGVVYVDLDDDEQWKNELLNELRNAGFHVQ